MKKNYLPIATLFVLLVAGCLFSKNNENTAVHATDNWEETVQCSDLFMEFAGNNANEVTADHGKYSFGVKHGKVTEGIYDFDVVTSNATSCSLKQSSDTDNQYAAVPWKTCICSANDDAVIVYFTALTDINFTSNPVTYGGWPTNAYVSYYLETENGIQTLSSTRITNAANSANEDGLDKTLVLAGQTIYYEFNYSGVQTSGNRRSIQTTLPNFTFDDDVPWHETRRGATTI